MDNQIYNFTLAEVLKTARLEKKLSISQVELQTKIRAEYLIALEESNYDLLPADIYIRGILGNYSKFLDLKYAELLRLYRKEGHALGLSDEKRRSSISIKAFLYTYIITNKHLFTGLFLLLSAGMVFYLYLQFQAVNTPPTLSVLIPQDNITTSQGEIIIRGETSKDTLVYVNGQIINIDSGGLFSLPYDLTEGTNKILFKAISNNNKKETNVSKTVFFVPQVKEENLGEGIGSTSDN